MNEPYNPLARRYDNEPKYKILRNYRDSNHPDHNKVIDSGLTLEEAQKHCNDPTTREPGVWFDCYVEDNEERRASHYNNLEHYPTMHKVFNMLSQQKGLGSMNDRAPN